MRVAQLDFADPAFPVTLTEVESPALPGPAWARVAVTRAGICGSDLHFFRPSTGSTPALVAYAAFPMDMGHEIVGRVVEAGAECAVPEGTPVAIDPVIACEARGIDPICPQCARGRQSVCLEIGSRRVTPGMGLGFTSGLGGGWGDEVVAHVSMLHPIPSAVPARLATLHEPLSIAVHGLANRPPDPGDPVLVLGAGIIGLCAIAALRALHPDSPVVAVARHPQQAELAASAGASAVIAADDPDRFAAYAEQARTTVAGKGAGAMLRGGFPYVIDAVGTAQTVTEALRVAGGRSTVLLLGATGVVEADLSPVWFKELALAGSFCHAADAGTHSVDQALGILAAGGLPDAAVTHEFSLADLRDAVAAGLDRAGGAVKVVLVP
jgi:threonine dehydrogenase-like Zn-dependent dehydrogenase